MLNKLLILLGIVFILISSFLYFQKESEVPIIIVENYQQEKITKPTLVIAELGINTPIYPAVIRDGKWQADSRGVSQNKNVIYGHNWRSILGNLTNAKVGMEMEIQNPDGESQEYEVYYTQTVDGDQGSLVEAMADDRIAIYTCTGFLDSKRFIVVAKRII
ncbi:sortase [Patescibacteria group bacterium]